MSNADSIKARLRNVAVQSQRPYEYIQTHYFVERLLFRLSKSRFANDFILKGGQLLYVLFENRARATRDIDLLAQHMSNAPEHVKEVFREICRIPADDAVEFDTSTLTAESIAEGADYSGVRVKVVCYLGRTRNTLQFDIGYGDIVIPKAESMIYPSLLSMDETQILAYSKESIIAEKFQAMIYLAIANSRMKDFYDVAMLASEYDFDGPTLQEAVHQTLERRATPMMSSPIVFTDDFSHDAGKLAQWAGFSNRIHNTTLSFSDALLLIRRFLMPVYFSILSGSECMGRWFHSERDWIYSKSMPSFT